MQSGRAGTNLWVLEFERPEELEVDPLTGNTKMCNTLAEVDLNFSSKEAAITYAKNNAIAFKLIESPKQKRISRSYGDNFAYDRKFPWTH